MNRTEAEKAAREKFEIFWKNELGQIPNDLLECLPNLKCQAWKNFCAGADIIERAGGQDATAQGPWTIRKDADFSGSADYPWMVVSNAPHGPCDANVFCSRMSEEDARMVVKALTSACGETAWAKSKELHEAWQAWLEQHGVPISMEFVRLANAVGEFTELARVLPSPPTAEDSGKLSDPG